jgi:hypothetical protein
MMPAPPFEHVLRLSDDVGMFEHADGVQPRREGGYCLDDVARALVVVCRERPHTDTLEHLAGVYLRFITCAQTDDGRCRNRLDYQGPWEEWASTGDWWGRALWGLGTAAARHPDPSFRADALARFELGAPQRSRHLRATAFAALGAAEVLTVHPGHTAARDLLASLLPLTRLADLRRDWPWPQRRLTYANAAIAEALLAAGQGLGDDDALTLGLGLLGWLLELQTFDGHLSVVPAGGWRTGEPRPAFDQQPIEAAALADACRRAHALTGQQRWADGLDLAIGWFLGDNDNGTALYDPTTGGGCDALTPSGRNLNQGAESTLAMVSTLQHAAVAAHR